MLLNSLRVIDAAMARLGPTSSKTRGSNACLTDAAAGRLRDAEGMGETDVETGRNGAFLHQPKQNAHTNLSASPHRETSARARVTSVAG
eukprot:4825818-Pleurochrysis_carterae.AAC.1